MDEKQKQMAQKILERWLKNPEILERLLISLQEEPEEWVTEEPDKGD